MSSEEYSETFFKGPAYALVIGISTYEHGRAAGQALGDKEFPNLKFAAKDAHDFASFLKNNGFITYNVRELFNEQAARENIIDELETLKKCCKEPDASNPLVIVYFSGHGWADISGRNYLIPHNAERDRLASTSLSNREFSYHLNEIETTRLVVFLDACHAGGVGIEGAKGELAHYDMRTLGEGTGCAIIASCQAGERSWEGEGNGVFTDHLLKLLRAETDDIKEESITVFNLYPVLRTKVLEATSHKQQPNINKLSGTGIVLAINQRLKQENIQKDKVAADEKQRFFELIRDRIKKSADDLRYPTITTLRKYVDENERFARFDEVYGNFDYCLKTWKGDSSHLDEWCDLLITAYRYAANSPTSSKEVQSQEPSAAVDKFVGAAEQKTIGADEPKALRTPAPRSDQSQARRALTAEDCEYVLAEIMTKLSYYQDTRSLRAILGQPVTEEEFARIVNGIALKKNDKDLDDILQRIVDRFQERWPESKEVEAKTLSSLMMGKE